MKAKWVAALIVAAFALAAVAAVADSRDRCGYCSGKGYVTCRTCWAPRGRVECSECERTGKVGDERSPTCEGTKFVPCPDCDGTGNVSCTKCDGSEKVKTGS